MKNLIIQTKEDLQKAKEDFKNSYFNNFNQKIRNSKVEAFMADFYGFKDYNSLLGSFKNEAMKFSSFNEMLSYFQGESATYEEKVHIASKYFPLNMGMVESSGNKNLGVIVAVEDGPTMSCYRDVEELYVWFNFFNRSKLNKSIEKAVERSREPVLSKSRKRYALDDILPHENINDDYYDKEEYTKTLYHLIYFYRELFNGSYRQAMKDALDFLYFTAQKEEVEIAVFRDRKDGVISLAK
jgi:hypothetical protein